MVNILANSAVKKKTGNRFGGTNMKKAMMALLLGTLLVAPALAQTGNVAVGPVYSLNFLGLQSPLNGLGITGKIPGLSPIFGLNFSLSAAADSFVGITSDWILYNQPLYAPFNINFFMGPGVYSSLYLAKSGTGSRFDLGLRIPFGVNWVPVKFIEAFLDVTPAFGITFRDPIAPGWLFQAETGVRIWF
jgi:hypothetical protein